MDAQNTTTQTVTEQVSKPLAPYVVAVCFSQWTLNQIVGFLEEKASATEDEMGVMRVDRFKGNDTNRTIILMTRELFDRAEKNDLTRRQKGLDFVLDEYELRDGNFPKEGFTRNFFITVPETLSTEEVKAQLQNKLDVLCRFGMFDKDQQPRLKIPLKSRDTGEHRKQAFVTFSRDTSDEVIALARVLLHDTRLYLDENTWVRMNCFWAKVKEARDDKSSPKDKKNSGRKEAPVKKGLIKTNPGSVKTDSTKSEKKEVPVQTFKALSPGENQWKKSLPVSSPVSQPAEGMPPVTDESPLGSLSFPVLK